MTAHTAREQRETNLSKSLLAPYLRARFQILALALLTACGSSDPKTLTSDGYFAMGKGDHALAISKFDSALSGLDTNHSQYRRAALGRCEAMAHVDPKRAKTEFLELARTRPELVGEDDYGVMCDQLLGVGADLEAIAVMEAGRDRFVSSPKMDAILEAVVSAAHRAKTPEAIRELEKMGYVGRGQR